MITKRQKILDAALILFSQQGLEGTSTGQIAKTAGVAKATLFHHFENKSLLIDELFRDLKLELFSTLQPHTGIAEQDRYQAFKFMWITGVEWALENPVAMKFFTNVHFDPTTQTREVIVSQMFASLDEIILKGQEDGKLMSLNIDLVRHFIHSHFLICANWLIEQSESPPEKTSKYINDSFDMCWRAIGGQIQ
ncbi:TetR/AcrR family transcriptional regulator [Vibrio cyclitrophicus]|uniref:TetR/AcrR family transcriptional regulator n=1 Tax=Vibrio cyclitrophicus TaxID=47951 RepID=UPI0002D64D5D|nr:TetR/AcrR family transcriptional regulator [Vibrio cyclitrophicus]ERM60615.1 Transcriptional regulator, TetR family [Vibrio cyclitrophicus FF75]OBS98338.1 TetR family transcriptional regulator [Vibrio cyclitrophicus]OEE45023.1 TetR family transcriptional regulator [Vibrio cyclitrophicus FF75]PMF22435.1 TetR family transcriptional regulator [Vibrio cyclitrophicus]PMF27392.1 TetR family transcriptional regulator [Vibrio cyclitrophicus]